MRVVELDRARRREQRAALDLDVFIAKRAEHVCDQYCARAVSDQMNLLLVGGVLQGVQEETGTLRARGALVREGPIGVGLHFIPEPCAQRTGHGLGASIEPIGESPDPLARRRPLVEDEVLQFFGESGVVHEVEGVDPVALVAISKRSDASRGRLGSVESAVRVEEQVVVLLAVAQKFGRLSDIISRAPVAAAALEIAVVDVGEMPSDLGARNLGLLGDRFVIGRRGGGRRSEDLGRRKCEPNDPGVHHVAGPVFIGPEGEASVAPARAPRILHPEALIVVSHHREGMSAVVSLTEGDLLPGVVPSGMDLGGYDDRACLVQRGVVVGNDGSDAVVGADRIASPLFGSLDGEAPRLAQDKGPRAFARHAVVMPAADRATNARALIVFALPLVVQLGHLVEHAWAGPQVAR